MFNILLLLLTLRTFLSTPIFPEINFIFSVAFFLFLISYAARHPVNLPDNIINKSAILFLFAVIFSILTAANTLNSLISTSQLICALLFTTICQYCSPKEQEKAIITVIKISSIISLLAIYQYLFGFDFFLNHIADNDPNKKAIMHLYSERRVSFPFITPNALGGYLSMGILLALSVRKTRIAIPFMLIALFLTKSIGAIMSLVTLLPLYFLLRGKISKTAVISLGAIVCSILTIAFIRDHNHNIEFQPLFSLHMRLEYWRQTLETIAQTPWGTGLGNFDLTQTRYAHNSYLQIWAETGVLGAASFLLVVIVIIREGFTRMRKTGNNTIGAGLYCACLVFLLHNLIDFTFFLPEISFTWCAITGILFSRSKNFHNSTR